MSKKTRKTPVLAGKTVAQTVTQTATQTVTKPAVKPSAKPAASVSGDAQSGASVGAWVGGLLAMMLFLAPAIGATTEELLQDTLKSIVVSGLALLAACVWVWRAGPKVDARVSTPVAAQVGAWVWHPLLLLPLALAVYALGSMVWSHRFLGAAEAIRWVVFAVVVWLVLSAVTRARVAWLAWGIHAGAVVAALWVALQFWGDFKAFPQGPNPGSTFVNRNFFAEYVVCALPFSLWLWWRLRGTALLALMSASLGFVVVTMLMTGTRSALISLAVLVLLLVALGVVVARGGAGARLARPVWTRAEFGVAAVVLVLTIAVLGNIGTGNANLIEEHRVEGRGLTAMQRSFSRAMSMTDRREYTERSFSLRWVMWEATARMIAARPITGVGAGAWEVDIPLYQAAGAQLETDYYVHNEVLQLLAEYGLIGWFFVLSLVGYLLHAAWRTLRLFGGSDESKKEVIEEAPLRTVVLTSLLLFLIISNAGFPWRLAATGALFAVCLGLLAASDMRLGGWQLGNWKLLHSQTLAWTARSTRGLRVLSVLGLLLCATISVRAVEAESLIVRAVRIALTVTASRAPNDPKWDETKAEMLELLDQGIAINPHYRKLTPMVADELAKWGDWTNATRIWESVAVSRPYVVAIMTNIARGHSLTGHIERAWPFLERCKQLQPRAASVRSLEVILLARTGRPAEAEALIRTSLDEETIDFDLVNAAYTLGVEQKHHDIAVRGLTLQIKYWPVTAAESWFKLGNLYADPKTTVHDVNLALTAYRNAYAATPDANKPAFKNTIPNAFAQQL